MIKLGENRYGKSRVRVVRVRRDGSFHQFHEWTLQILLQGDFESCFAEADNSKILPTDTIKNTVYSLARRSGAANIEDFAKELVDFFLSRNPQVSHAEAKVSEKSWQHLAIGGRAHPTTFVQASDERQTTTVRQTRNNVSSVESGIENLIIMKTAKSGFEGYIQDSLTTLPPTADRLLGTALRADWSYAQPDSDFASLRAQIREALLVTFAEHDSKSVQHTLYAMAEAVLGSVDQVSDIKLTMPNLHCLLVDLSRFGQDNPNEIFLPIDEPHGYIEARVSRG
jgi:urate oxidase